MAAVSGPTQEGLGLLRAVPTTLPPHNWRPEDPMSVRGPLAAPSPHDICLARKVAVNAYLPVLADGYARGTVTVEDLVAYFRRSAHLYSVGIDVNAICNLSCGYCYLDKCNSKTVPRYAPLSEVDRVIRSVLDAGTDLIALVGKEPFADDRGLAVLRSLDSISDGGRRCRFGVVTNGTLIDRVIDHLPPSIAYVDVSLDGLADVNDATRGRGSFARAVHGIKLLRDRGFEVWISAVLHEGTSAPRAMEAFVRTLAEEYGCGRMYFSPVRNFTGSLDPFLLSFDEIARAQDLLAGLAASVAGVEMIVLDHPYEAVWRDYFWPVRKHGRSRLDELAVDGFGNVLEPLSTTCVRKLDVFPHGPWATCRIDPGGLYLADVEARTFAQPRAVGSIEVADVWNLHRHALETQLPDLMNAFLRHMGDSSALSAFEAALTSVSMPLHQTNPDSGGVPGAML